MIIIPAIDLRGGDCVRLLQGRKDEQTHYSDDPVAMAHHWEDQGAERIHVVDLDGAFEEPSENKDVIRGILDEVTVPCEVGGGLRSKQAVRDVLQAGADAVVIGTAGVKEPSFLEELVDEFDSDSIIAGVDCKDRQVMVKGWEEGSGRKLEEWLQRLETIGIQTIIYTDVSRDGTEEGPNQEAIEKLLQQTRMDVIASGGVGTRDHLAELKQIERDNLTGIIVGRALYEKNFTLPEAREILSD